MQGNWKRKARALTAALLILSATTLALPESASAGHGRKVARHRVAHHGYARVHRPRYRHRSYYAYRPYRYTYYRPRYREVFVEDPYCTDDVYYVRPV